MLFSKNVRFNTISLRARRILTFVLVVAVCGTWVTDSWAAKKQFPALEIKEGDSIVILGNTFAERMHLFGYFETFLHSKFSEHHLKIRNIGWSADEVTLAPRPLRFGDRHQYLDQEKADLIFVCFGLNEAFGGPKGVAKFQQDLSTFIEDIKSHQYNGHSSPRIVLVSPIAHENLGGLLPDGKEHNENLDRYTQAMAEVADRHNVILVDLFTPTRELMGLSSDKKLTNNGIHLNAYGDWAVSQMMARSLGLIDDIAPPSNTGNGVVEKLRRTIYDKNYSFFFHYHPPNAEYIHGQRRDLPGAERLPEELNQLYNIIGQLDEMIWEMDKPQPEAVWEQLPPEKPLWASTPEYQGITIPDIGEVRLTRRQPDNLEEILTTVEALEEFNLPDGYEMNLYASEINFKVANPLALNFDAKGRLWIANSPTWPHPHPGKQPEDSIVILEDTDHDGVADKQTVFMDHLNMVHGFALGDGGAYIAQTPNVIHAKDTDGDDKADTFKIVLHGFGGEDVEHSINNFKWGPDGALYFMEGTFFHTQVETARGPARSSLGSVFRYKPTTERFEVFVNYRFANPWGQVYDRWGQSIVLDASGHNFYNMDLLSAKFAYPSSRRNAKSFSHGRLGSGGGINLIVSRHFPDEVQGRFVSNQICGGFSGSIWWDIEEDGTTYKVKRIDPELLVSNDHHMGPIASAFGPDGALYLVDFHTPLAENTSMPKRYKGRDHTHGRIWRITYKNRPLLTPPKIAGEPVPVLLELLKVYENSTRHLVRRELQQRDADEVIPHIEEWIAGLDTKDPLHDLYLLEVLWIYQGLDVLEPQLLKRVLKADDYRIRASATRALRFLQHDIDDSLELLRGLVNDEHIRVRMHAVLALSASSSEDAMGIALEATQHPMDPGIEKVLEDTLDYFDRSRSLE